MLLSGVTGTVLPQPAQADAATAVAAPVSSAPGAAEPPALPRVTKGCLGPSPTVVETPPWAVRRIGPSAAWPLTRGDGVVVAVIDSGVSAGATGLSGAVRSGTDVTRSGAGNRDCFGRGTALAGIVAARPTTGSGFVGVAPGAAILPIRVVNAKGEVPDGALAAGIRAAAAAKADVILIGFGTETPDADLRRAVREAVSRDIVLVAAISGEKATGTTQAPAPWYPAADPDVLAVGGFDLNGAPTEEAPPSAGVDLLAPGAGAVSVAPQGPGHYSVAGSSVAAAYAAGAAALVRAYHPDLSQAEVRHRLELAAEHPLGTWPVPQVGYGILDVYKALTAVELRETALATQAPVFPPLPVAEPADPRTLIAALVAVGVVGLAGLAHLSRLTIRWGRRRRWRA
ncbi:S8 family serine peptidase [Micromonospora sp. NPDC049366]|uniref:S8 family serine peptidase n=1 Tax=Micromonospora sp. NPDC049366 TaxID=3364271 RepID=UPI0037B59685